MHNGQEAESLDDFEESGNVELEDKIWFLTDVEVDDE